MLTISSMQAGPGPGDAGVFAGVGVVTCGFLLLVHGPGCARFCVLLVAIEAMFIRKSAIFTSVAVTSDSIAISYMFALVVGLGLIARYIRRKPLRASLRPTSFPCSAHESFDDDGSFVEVERTPEGLEYYVNDYGTNTYETLRDPSKALSVRNLRDIWTSEDVLTPDAILSLREILSADTDRVLWDDEFESKLMELITSTPSSIASGPGECHNSEHDISGSLPSNNVPPLPRTDKKRHLIFIPLLLVPRTDDGDGNIFRKVCASFMARRGLGGHYAILSINWQTKEIDYFDPSARLLARIDKSMLQCRGTQFMEEVVAPKLCSSRGYGCARRHLVHETVFRRQLPVEAVVQRVRALMQQRIDADNRDAVEAKYKRDVVKLSRGAALITLPTETGAERDSRDGASDCGSPSGTPSDWIVYSRVADESRPGTAPGKMEEPAVSTEEVQQHNARMRQLFTAESRVVRVNENAEQLQQDQNNCGIFVTHYRMFAEYVADQESYKAELRRELAAKGYVQFLTELRNQLALKLDSHPNAIAGLEEDVVGRVYAAEDAHPT